jgi:DNA modification methylase
MKTNTVIYGDAIQEMRKLPDNSVDIIIADPPYNVSKGGTYSITQKDLVEIGTKLWNHGMIIHFKNISLLALIGLLKQSVF